jgi:hypothetical protein
MSIVLVFHFRIWDFTKGEWIVQPLKSTAENIKEIGGEVIPESGEEIDPSELDEYGRYDPCKEPDAKGVARDKSGNGPA